MENLASFRLNRTNRLKEFSFQKNYSFISIRRMVCNSLSGAPDVWSPILTGLNPSIIITCYGANNSTLKSSLFLTTYISPHHYNPIIVFQQGYIIPEENAITIPPSGVTSFHTTQSYIRATLELNYNGIDNVGTDDFELTIMYEKTQGVY